MSDLCSQELLALRKEFEQQQALLARYSTNPPPLTPGSSLTPTSDPFNSLGTSPEGGSNDTRLYESPMQKATEVKFEDEVEDKKDLNADVPPLEQELEGKVGKESSEQAVEEGLGEVTKPL